MSTEEDKLGFCAYVRSLDEAEGVSSSTTFRIFDRGEFYSLYGVNAEVIADTFFHSREFLKYLGSQTNPLPATHVSKARLGPVLNHILITLRKPVQMYGRPKGSPKDSLNWSITKKATAGDVSAFSDLVSTSASATTMCVTIAIYPQDELRRLCSVATVDTVTLKLKAGVFADTDVFASLEACLAQLRPADCYYHISAAAKAATNESVVTDVLTRAEVNFQPIPENYLQDSREALSEVVNLLTDEDRPVAWQLHSDSPSVAAPLTAVCAQLSLLPAGSVPGKAADYRQSPLASQRFSFSVVDLDQYMKLDNAASVALNLFPSPTDASKSMSLYGLLNRTQTKMGARLLDEWIRLPLLHLPTITQRQDAVEAFLTQPSALHGMRDALKSVMDVEMVCKRVQKRKSNADAGGKADSSEHIIQDMVQLYNFAKRVPLCIAALDELTGPCAARVKERFQPTLVAQRGEVDKYVEMVETTVDLAAVGNHEYLINPSFNEDLEALSNRKAKLVRGMERVLPDIAAELDLDEKKVKLQRSSIHGHVFRVSRRDEKNLRSSKSITCLETRKDGVKFTCKALSALSDSYEEAMKEYGELQKEVVVEALNITHEYIPVLDQLCRVCTELDVLSTFAFVSQQAFPQYVRPQLVERSSVAARNGDNTDEASTAQCLRVIKARHPCLEVQAGVSFIPNDIVLEKGKSNFQIITGPNMGGKSTYIRSAGVLAVMAQIGCFLPCESAVMPVLDSVLARVGAGDSQLRGVSTFMKEMLEASTILKVATADSLVIIDELGRGTSTYDGFGLAWAIAEHLAQKTNCFTFFATHFHELCALSKVQSNVVNKHVMADTTADSITMLYQLRDGSCDRSYGIHVSELANFPPEVVAMARAKAAELEQNGDEAAVMMQLTSDGSGDTDAEQPDSKRVKREEAEVDAEAVKVFLTDVFGAQQGELDLADIVNKATAIFGQD